MKNRMHREWLICKRAMITVTLVLLAFLLAAVFQLAHGQSVTKRWPNGDMLQLHVAESCTGPEWLGLQKATWIYGGVAYEACWRPLMVHEQTLYILILSDDRKGSVMPLTGFAQDEPL